MTIEFSDSEPNDLPQMMERLYYEFEDEDFDSNGGSAIVIALPEQIEFLELPTSSNDLRVRRFLYDNPEDAAYIDELAYRARTSDQTLIAFGEYYIDINVEENPYDIETLKNAIAYLQSRTELEQYANYHVSFTGDVILLDGKTGIPTKAHNIHKGIAHIRGITLHPANTHVDDIEHGQHTMVPFLDIVFIDKRGKDKDKQLLIPCSSFISIKSVRFQDE